MSYHYPQVIEIGSSVNYIENQMSYPKTLTDLPAVRQVQNIENIPSETILNKIGPQESKE